MISQGKRKGYFLPVGPGGMKCNCCGPAPKHRRKYFRIQKRRERRAFQKEIQKELEND